MSVMGHEDESSSSSSSSPSPSVSSLDNESTLSDTFSFAPDAGYQSMLHIEEPVATPMIQRPGRLISRRTHDRQNSGDYFELEHRNGETQLKSRDSPHNNGHVHLDSGEPHLENGGAEAGRAEFHQEDGLGAGSQSGYGEIRETKSEPQLRTHLFSSDPKIRSRFLTGNAFQRGENHVSRSEQERKQGQGGQSGRPSDKSPRRLMASTSAPVRMHVHVKSVHHSSVDGDNQGSECSSPRSEKSDLQSMSDQTGGATCGSGTERKLVRTKSLPSRSFSEVDDSSNYRRSITEGARRKKTQESRSFRTVVPEKLSDRKKKKLMRELVNKEGGFVEFDVMESARIATNLFGPGIFDEGGEVGEEDVGEEEEDRTRRDIPPLEIVMLIVGTRGDVQPFVAIGKHLQEYGHRVRLATHSNFREFVMTAGLEFYPLGGDPKVLAGYMVKNKGFLPSGPSEISIQRKQIKAIIHSLLPACTAADPEGGSGLSFRAQAIIANPPAYVFYGKGFYFMGTLRPGLMHCLHHTLYEELGKSYPNYHQMAKSWKINFSRCWQSSGHVHVAEYLQVPLHIFFTMPWTATSEFPHPLSRVKSTAGYRDFKREVVARLLKLPPAAATTCVGQCWMSYQVVDSLIWWGIRSMINDFRKKKLKLRPITYLSGSQGSIAELPTGYIWSPHLVPKPRDWGPLVDVVGFCFLNLAQDYKPPQDLVDWLQAGPPPIYVGFGSLPVVDPQGMTTIILKALEMTHQRGIIYKGWGGIGDLCEASNDIYLVEDCPHDWLFKQCVAVVHHGGAGTTAAGLKAACPTTVVPFFGDQPFWGERIHAKGVGPPPIPVDQFSLDKLVKAIEFMLNDEVKQQAIDMAQAMEKEDGVEGAVKAFHKHLRPATPQPFSIHPPQRMRLRAFKPFRIVYNCFM